LAPQLKGKGAHEIVGKSSEACWNSSEIADRKYDYFHITVFELGMLTYPLTKHLDIIIYAQHLEDSSSGKNVH